MALVARLSSSSMLTFSSTAIWSMKAPVPPAQLPFMRRSAARPLRKNTTLASSPPMSMSDDVSGWRFMTAFVAATTSWTKGRECFSEKPMPTEPVSLTLASASPQAVISSFSTLTTTSLALALCLSYLENSTFPASSKATILAVVEPMSIPILIIMSLV